MSADLRVINSLPKGDNIIKLLEDVIEIAHNGELSSIALCFVYRDGSTGMGFSDAANMSTMLGAIVRLQHKMLEE